MYWLSRPPLTQTASGEHPSKPGLYPRKSLYCALNAVMPAEQRSFSWCKPSSNPMGVGSKVIQKKRLTSWLSEHHLAQKNRQIGNQSKYSVKVLISGIVIVLCRMLVLGLVQPISSFLTIPEQIRRNIARRKRFNVDPSLLTTRDAERMRQIYNSST